VSPGGEGDDAEVVVALWQRGSRTGCRQAGRLTHRRSDPLESEVRAGECVALRRRREGAVAEEDDLGGTGTQKLVCFGGQERAGEAEGSAEVARLVAGLDGVDGLSRTGAVLGEGKD